MKRTLRRSVAFALAACAAAFAGAPPTRAAETAAAGDSTRGPWEDVVFLPESGLAVLLERDPRGVLLDRGTYLDLHRRARESRRGAASTLPGPAVRILRCDAQGVVTGEEARVELRLTVLSRGAARETLSLRIGGSIVSATVDGVAATLGAGADGVLTLALRGEGLHEAVVTTVAPVVRNQGTREVSVDLPAAPASRWSLEIAGRVAATAGDGLSRTERLVDPGRTRIVSFGAAAGLRAAWREGDQGTDLPPLVRAKVRTLAEVGERSLDALVLVQVECSRSPRDRFVLELPPALAVLGVDGEGASLLELAGSGAAPGRFELRFAEPFTGTRSVLVRTTGALDGPGAAELPVVRMPDAATTERTLAVRFKDGLRGFVEADGGASRLDPALSDAGAVDALYRIDAEPVVRAHSERPSVMLRADARVLLDLADDGPWLAASFLYLPRGDRLYGVDPLLPPGFLPESVLVSGDRAFLRGTTPDGRLSLVFPGGVAAGSAVTVTVRGRWPVEGWSVEDAAERTAPLPRLDAGTAVETDGWLGVSVPPGVETREEETAGLVAAAVGELRERAGFAADDLALGWRFRGSSPGGRLRVTRPAASVTAAVALLATPAEDHLSIAGSVAITVQRSGIREARISVVPSLGDLLRIEGADVAERRRVTDAGRDTWILRFGRLVRDGTTLVLRAELPLAAGSAAVPAVSVEGATRHDLLIGVAAHRELDVTTETAGLRAADAAEFVPLLGAGAGGLLGAWRGERDSVPSLKVRAARLPPSPLPSAFADRVSLRTVLGMDGIARTRLDAQVRNADRQALEVTLPAGARLSSARVAGEAVRPVRTAAGVLLVPIVPSAQPFDVVLIYEETVPEDSGAASLLAPDLGIPGSRAVWTLHLPEGSIPLSAEGEFSGPPLRPGDPWCLRLAEGLFGDGTRWEEEVSGSAGPRARAARPAPAPVVAMESAPDAAAAQQEAPSESSVPADGDFDREPKGPPPAARIQARAAQRGLFGMDIRLLAAGPTLTATRLGPTGSIDLRWRTASGRTTAAFLAGVLAFLAAVLARRRGVNAALWTLLALAFLTAAPVVLGTVDTSAWDGAAVATVLYAALALVLAIVRRVRLPLPRRRVAAAAAALLLLAAGARAEDAKARAPAPPADPQERVFVPYDPKRPETLRTPERVFLSYERYRELWNATHPGERIDAALPPVVVAAEYKGRVEGRALVLLARYEIDPADGGVVALPPGAAVDGLTLDGRPVAATTAAPGGATLVFVPRSAAPGGRATIEATLRWPVAGDAPGGSLRAPIPRAPRTSLTVDLPVADAVVNVVSAGGFAAAPHDGGTRVAAALGPVQALDLGWQPRGADAAGGRTRFEIETEMAARLRPGVVEWSAALVLRVLAGTVQEIETPLPAGLVVQSVAGTAVASWTVVEETTLRIRLLGAAPGETKIAVTGLLASPSAGAPVTLPDFAFRGAAADRSRVTVSADEGRLAVSESAGLERTDAAAGAPAGSLVFRRVRTPSRLVVRAEPPAADLAAMSRQHLHLGADASRLRAEFDLVPGPRGLFEATVALPAGWTLDDVAGAASFPGPGAVRLVLQGAPGAARSVVLSLSGPAAGTEPMPFPLLRIEGARRESAELLVSTAPGYSAAAAAATGLDPVPADRFAGWPQLDPAETRSLAWRDAQGGGAVSLRREALLPSIRPTVVADLTVLDDRVIVDALLHFDVKGGVERVFRVDAPAGVRGAWVLGDGLREVRREDVSGRERLTVTMQAAATGAVVFRVLYDLPVPATGAIDVAGPEPVGGEGARAFLLLRALGEAEVQVGVATGVETCDVSDVPIIPEGLDPLRVLRFLRARDTAWRLPLKLAAHEFGDLPAARIHLVEATTVADRDGSARTRVDARLFNRARGFLPVLLPEGADLEVVLVGGLPVRPVTKPSEPGVVQIPVRVQSLGEESQVVSLTFRTQASAPGESFSSLAPRLPSFPGVPVDATTWRLLLPEDRDYSFSGNMDEVAATEVAIARAEAYANDVSRLRTVLSKGNRQQQEVAWQNLVTNTREMQESLDVARSGLEELSRAAAEGKVDATRLAEGRRKADALAKEIDDALGDVRRNEALGLGRQGGESGARAGLVQTIQDGESNAAADLEKDRYSTKEGQAFKRWASNSAAPEVVEAAKQSENSRRATRLLVDRTADVDGGKGKSGGRDEAEAALAAHGTFAEKSALRGRAGDPPVPQGGPAAGPATPGGPSTGGGGDSGGPGGATGGTPLAGGPGLVAPPRPARTAGVSAFVTFGRGGGGGGGGDRFSAAERVAPSVEGLISLAPPLVEQGRVYSFRKLDASADVSVSPRTPGIVRRLLGAGSFGALLALLLVIRRRRAAAQRRTNSDSRTRRSQ